MYVAVKPAQIIKLAKVRYGIGAGTSVTFKLQRNGVDIANFTGLSATTTPATTDPVDVTLDDGDTIQVVVTAVSGTPTNFTVMLALEYEVAPPAGASPEAVNVVGASGAAQTIPDPLVTPNSRITLTASCTLTFPSPVPGTALTIALIQDATGGRTVTWPTSVKWSGAAPTLTATASKLDLFSFVALDNSSWLGLVAGQDYTV